MIRVPAIGPSDAKIVIVGEAPGREEELHQQPFIGPSGLELTKMLHEAGISRSDCYITNAVKFRPAGNDISEFFSDSKCTKPLPIMAEGIEELKKEIAQVNPQVIITLGNTPTWALTGHRGITDWRGSILDYNGATLIPTYHPAAILRQWDWRPIAVHDLRRANSFVDSRPVYPDYNFVIRPSIEAVLSFITAVRARADVPGSLIHISVDIETRGSLIACIGIATDTRRALCIPLMCVERREGYWSEHEELQIVLALRDLLTHPTIRVIGQNFLYDAQYFARYLGFVPRVSDDTMFMHHICFPGLPKGLDFLSSMYCKYHVYWKNEGKEWDKHIPEEQLWSYNCKDAVITFEVFEELQKLIAKFSLVEQYQFQMSLFMPVLRMMLHGIRIDQKLRNELNLSLEDELVKRQLFINSAVGKDINISSPKQLQDLFYNELGMAVVNNRKTGRPTTDDTALEKFATREPILRPLVERINECRRIKVFQSTFVQAKLSSDQRMRCSFNPAGTETYRFNSSADAFDSGTNLQNVPRGEEDEEAQLKGEFRLPNIRKLFLPDPNKIIFDVDLAGADAQVVAWEAGDKILKQMFRERVKIHAENAKLIYKGASGPDGKREPYYTRAKMGVHASNYGASARTVAAAIGVTVREAEDFQHIWFSAHPEIKQWHRTVEHSLQTTRSVSNKFGYRRIYFDRIESILPEALAWIPQSTVACTINRGLVNIDNNLKDVEILLQVHDSLVLQLPIEKSEILKPQIIEQLKIVIPYQDPLIIPVGIKESTRSWGDCQ